MTAGTYRHTQIGWVMLICLGGAGAIVGVAATTSLWLWGIVAVCLLLFPTLTVVGGPQGLKVWFGPGLIRVRFAWQEIALAVRVRNSWLSGWGLRWNGSGWLFNVSGLRAVELRLKNGKIFRIGTDDPNGLHAFIAAHLEEP